MSNTIVKRMEKLLSRPCLDQKPANERSGSVTTCTRLRRLQQMQSELITLGRLVDNHADQDAQTTSIRELIAARIAQTEHDDNTSAKNEGTASIYFWSPCTSLVTEKRKSRFRLGRSQGRPCVFSNDQEDSSTHKSKDAFVRFSQPALIMIARNKETPTSTLKWLAAHHSAEIRTAVAQNENTDDETLDLLAQDHSDNVRSAVLDNTRINKELAIKLSGDRSLCISTKARSIYYQLDMKSKKPVSITHPQNTDNRKDMLKYEREFLKTAANSASFTHRLIVQPPCSADWHIRMLVAGNPNTTAEMLWQLSSHPVSQVKRKLVDKYNCLLETLVDLTGHKKSEAQTSTEPTIVAI